ncbi:MAG TPA: S41 family peptidase [Gemmatimonadales bacterium]|nr:S41 family peptidase [Gemmatimonadales bacterium]
MSTRSLALACLLHAPLIPLAAQQLTATERAEAVATIWAEARYNFAYWDRTRADWDSAFVANLKLAAAPQSDFLFYRRLRRFVAVLGDGQAAVIPAPSLRSRIARPPLLVQSVERRSFILDYAENDEMRVARPERLGEILAVQGIPADAWIRDSVLPEISAATPANRWQRAAAVMLQGEKGTTLQLLLRVPSGDQRGVSVTRSVSLNDRWPLDPPPFAVESLSGSLVVVRLNSLADQDVVPQFDRAFPDFAGVQGLVLDLRRAAGGKTDYAYRLLARLTGKPFAAARWRTPDHRAVFRAWNQPDSATTWYEPSPDTIHPRGDQPSYGGPLSVLASAITAGAAEDFLAAFRAANRGAIIGEPSAGSPGDAATFALPKSWTVQFSVTHHMAPDGSEFAGLGVRPDILLAPSVRDVLAGMDPALQRAREYLEDGRRR